MELAIEKILTGLWPWGRTLSGEHGTGLAKAPFLEKETGRSAILFSRRLRKALDPFNILNPVKSQEMFKMDDMKSLARRVKELEDQLVVCIRCGTCQSVCPLFEQTHREADVARGKLALLDGLGKNMFENAKGVEERLNRCLLCGPVQPIAQVVSMWWKFSSKPGHSGRI